MPTNKFDIFIIMKIKDAVGNLHSLAQETRLRVFRLLVRAGSDGLPAGDIAARLGVPAATMSFHLAHLARAGLIAAVRDGRSIRYSANFAAMRRLLDFLTEDCCQGNPQLCAPAPSERRNHDETPARARQG